MSITLEELRDTLQEGAESLRLARAELVEYQAHPYGPEMTPDLTPSAADACVALCAGDKDKARTLWKLIVADLGGYMPRAAVLVLMRAAHTENLVPDITAPEPQ